jgi:tetratricopeptide (TPR) repeat protein
MSDKDRKTKVFISYSRSDSRASGNFGEALRSDLLDHGFDAFIDVQDILPGEDWKSRLHHLIAQCDVFIFCISPNSVTSQVCDWETNEAERLGKRVLPVVCLPTSNDSIPPRLNRLNHIFLRPADDRVAELNRLVSAINTDISWLRLNTWIGERASDWQLANFSPSKLLGGADLTAAEEWRDAPPSATAGASQLILDYIRACRNRQTRSSRIRFGVAVSVATLAIVLSAWALWNRQKAIDSRDDTVRTAQSAAWSASTFVYKMFGGYDEAKLTIDSTLKSELLDSAYDLSETIAALRLHDTVALQARGAVQIERSGSFLHANKVDEALTAANDAVKQFSSLKRALPNDYGIRRDLAVAYDRLGSAYTVKPRPEDAAKAYLDGIEQINFSLSDDPDPSAQLTKAILLEKLGDLRGNADDWSAAEVLFQQSHELKAAVASLPTSTPEYKRHKAESLRKQAEAKLRMDDAPNAIILLTEVQSELGTLYKVTPTQSVLRDMVDTKSLLGDAFDRVNRQKAALDAMREAYRNGEEFFQRWPNCQSFVYLLVSRNSLALNLLFKHSDAPAVIVTLQDSPVFSGCPPDSIEGNSVALARQVASAAEDVANELSILTRSNLLFSSRLLDILRQFQHEPPSVKTIDKWEDANTRFAIFVAKRAQQAGQYGDAFRVIRQLKGILDTRRCDRTQECRLRALAEGQLAWSALLAGEFSTALASSEKAMEMVRQKDLSRMAFITLNYAHALLFAGSSREASEIYKTFNSREILDDFRVIKASGHCHPFMASYDISLTCTVGSAGK